MVLTLGNKHCSGITYDVTEKERALLLQFAQHINEYPETNITIKTDKLIMVYKGDYE